MSNPSHDDDVIPNATEIVERFGGIRPMASKLNVPVTTVQGWKKRNAIPAIRREEILNAAAHYNVDLRGLALEGANENSQAGAIAEDPALSAARVPPAPPQSQTNRPSAAPAAQHAAGGIDMRQIKNAARRTSFITTVAILAVVAGAGFLLFGGDGKPANTQRVDALEGRVTTLEQQSGTSISGSISQTVNSLQQKVDALVNSGTSISERLAALEAQIRASGAPGLADVAGEAQAMISSPQSAGDWQAAIADLRNIVTGLQGRTDQLDAALAQAQQDNDALAHALSDVSGRDLGAAAMLLTLTQLRSAIDRQTPFADDLAMLRAMTGASDPALAESIDRLAPYAESGVLSAPALKRELQASANDIITAKLKGEDVSIKDKIMGRLRGLFSIRKDGEEIGGSGERALIDQAQAQLDDGDVQGAMTTLQQLQGPSAEAAAPWQEKAAATVAAQGLETQLAGTILNKIRASLATLGHTSDGGITAGSAPINMAPMTQPLPQGAPFPPAAQDAMPVPGAQAPMPVPEEAPQDNLPETAPPPVIIQQ